MTKRIVDDRFSGKLVRSVRGGRTQSAVASDLGYSFNIMTRWETGRIRIGWRNFVRLCAACDVDVHEMLLRVFCYSGDVTTGGKVLHAVIEGRSVPEASGLLGVPPYQLARWLRGRIEVPLVVMLRAIAVFTDRLDEVVRFFETRNAEAPRGPSSSSWTPLDCVIAALLRPDSKDGALGTRRLARAIGLSEVDVRRSLLRLDEAGLLARTPDGWRLLAEPPVVASDYDADSAQLLVSLMHGNGFGDGAAGSSVFCRTEVRTLSPAAEAAVTAILLETLRRLRGVFDRSGDGEGALRILQVALLDPLAGKRTDEVITGTRDASLSVSDQRTH